MHSCHFPGGAFQQIRIEVGFAQIISRFGHNYVQVMFQGVSQQNVLDCAAGTFVSFVEDNVQFGVTIFVASEGTFSGRPDIFSGMETLKIGLDMHSVLKSANKSHLNFCAKNAIKSVFKYFNFSAKNSKIFFIKVRMSAVCLH